MSAATISIEQVFERNRKDEVFLLEKMKNPAEIPAYAGNFRSLNRQDAAYYITRKEYDKAKQCYYKIGMTSLYQYEKLGLDLLSTADALLYPLLSDNKKLIERCMHYEPPVQEDSFPYYFGRAIQTIWSDQLQLLNENIAGLKKHSQKGSASHYTGVIDVFQGLVDKDKAMIEKGLMDLIKQHGRQEQPLVVKEYINLEATGLAKLAWYKGWEVKADSPLFIKELLPVHELSSYESYPFFNELE